MKKITFLFNVLAAIIAVTILQACAHTPATQCAKPTLNPPSGTGQPVTVTIATATVDAYLRYTLDGTDPSSGPSPKGTIIPAQSGQVPDVFGRTLKAIGYKAGMTDSPIASGKY